MATQKQKLAGLRACITLASLLPLTACTGLEPAVIGAAVSGASAGVAIFEGAEIYAYEEVAFEEAVAAVEDAAAMLALKELNRVEEGVEPGAAYAEQRVWIYHRFDGSEKLVVEVTRPTEAVTSIRVFCGDPHLRGFATLYLARVYEVLGRDAPFRR